MGIEQFEEQLDRIIKFLLKYNTAKEVAIFLTLWYAQKGYCEIVQNEDVEDFVLDRNFHRNFFLTLLKHVILMDEYGKANPHLNRQKPDFDIITILKENGCQTRVWVPNIAESIREVREMLIAGKIDETIILMNNDDGLLHNIITSFIKVRYGRKKVTEIKENHLSTRNNKALLLVKDYFAEIRQEELKFS